MILEQSKISQPGTMDVWGQVSLCSGGTPYALQNDWQHPWPLPLEIPLVQKYPLVPSQKKKKKMSLDFAKYLEENCFHWELLESRHYVHRSVAPLQIHTTEAYWNRKGSIQQTYTFWMLHQKSTSWAKVVLRAVMTKYLLSTHVTLKEIPRDCFTKLCICHSPSIIEGYLLC